LPLTPKATLNTFIARFVETGNAAGTILNRTSETACVSCTFYPTLSPLSVIDADALLCASALMRSV
jgi:hypothetical protein